MVDVFLAVIWVCAIYLLLHHCRKTLEEFYDMAEKLEIAIELRWWWLIELRKRRKQTFHNIYDELQMIKKVWVIRRMLFMETDYLLSDRAKFFLGIHHHYKPAVSLVLFKRKPFKAFTVRADKADTHLPKKFCYMGTLDDMDQVAEGVLSVRFQHEGSSYYGTFTPSSGTWR